MSSTLSANVEAFARLFEAVHEGVYIGAIDSAATLTSSANPQLKLMFGFAADTPEADVRPFEPDRFVDPQARDGFIARLQRDGSVTDYLLRLRRADRSSFCSLGDDDSGGHALAHVSVRAYPPTFAHDSGEGCPP